jgi:hypothetical protein
MISRGANGVRAASTEAELKELGGTHVRTPSAGSAPRTAEQDACAPWATPLRLTELQGDQMHLLSSLDRGAGDRGVE